MKTMLYITMLKGVCASCGTHVEKITSTLCPWEYVVMTGCSKCFSEMEISRKYTSTHCVTSQASSIASLEEWKDVTEQKYDDKDVWFVPKKDPWSVPALPETKKATWRFLDQE